MRRSSIMKGTAIVAVFFGIPLMLSPNAVLAVYSAPLANAPGVTNSMLYGACLVAIGLMNWMAAAQSTAAARPVVIGSFVVTVLGTLISLQRQLTDQAPAAAWLNVALYAVLLLLYGRLLLRREAAREPSPVAGA
jgi:Ca2+/H+ antiporter